MQHNKYHIIVQHCAGDALAAAQFKHHLVNFLGPAVSWDGNQKHHKNVKKYLHSHLTPQQVDWFASSIISVVGAVDPRGLIL